MSDPHPTSPAPTDSHAPAHDPQDPHAAPHDAHDIEHHIWMYWKVGIILLAFTLITVGLSYVDFDRMFKGHGWNMKIGLVVATFKVSLVMAIFMHLKEERSTIWRVLYFTFFFVAGLFLLTLFAWVDPIFGTSHWHH
jgi:cytochrome c oxidase subunit IV